MVWQSCSTSRLTPGRGLLLLAESEAVDDLVIDVGEHRQDLADEGFAGIEIHSGALIAQRLHLIGGHIVVAVRDLDGVNSHARFENLKRGSVFASNSRPEALKKGIAEFTPLLVIPQALEVLAHPRLFGVAAARGEDERSVRGEGAVVVGHVGDGVGFHDLVSFVEVRGAYSLPMH